MWGQSSGACGYACAVNDRDNPVKMARVKSNLELKKVQVFGIEKLQIVKQV